MKKISVIIPVKNEGKKIKNCLEAVFSQTYRPYEVIVVDGRSTDDTVKNAQTFPVKIFYEDYHTRAGANQIGINNAIGDYIAFTDADCIPKKDWLENLISEFNEDVVGVGGGIINLGNNFWEKSINLAVSTFLGSANSVQGRLFSDKCYVNSISGCNSIYRKKDLIDIGGFDVRLGTAEDTELNRRLLKVGKLLYTPNAIILHNHNRGIKDFAKRMHQYGYGRAKSRLWDLQIIPPIMLVAILAVSILSTPWLFIGLFGLYVIVVGLTGLKYALTERNIKLFISMPVVFVIEHAYYTLGFWRGILSR
jgi:GT2 family glycosyltransferase